MYTILLLSYGLTVVAAGGGTKVSTSHQLVTGPATNSITDIYNGLYCTMVECVTLGGVQPLLQVPSIPLPTLLPLPFPRPQQGPPPQSDSSDRPIVALKRRKRSIVPKCYCEGLNCQCCVGPIRRAKLKAACIKTSYNINELTMNIQVDVDGKTIANRSIGPDVVPFCIPNPPLTFCLSARRVLFTKETATLCLGLEIKLLGSPIYKGRLPCFNMQNGQFSVSRK